MTGFDGIPGLLPHATPESLELVRKNVPAELQQLPNWVCGDRSPKTLKSGEVKSSKAPINPGTGGKARSNDPTTWGTLDQAITYALGDEKCFGVGVNLLGTEYLGFDLDNVFDRITGEFNQEAECLIEALPPTYIEKSPSGRGLRLFFKGRKPAEFNRSKIDNAFGPGTALEVYDCSTGRYLTTTGNIWSAEALPIATVTDADLHALLDLLPERKSAKSKRASERSTSTARHDDITRARWGLLEAKLLDPDCGYHGWLRVGVALKALGDSGLELWDLWSQQSKDFDPDEIRAKWPGIDGSSINCLFGMFDDADPSWRDRFRNGASTEVLRNGSDDATDPNDGHDHGLTPLGERDPASGRFIFSAKRTLPTAEAFVREFHTHPDGPTLVSHAGQLLQWHQNRYAEVEVETLTQRLHPWLHEALTYKKLRDGSLELVPFDANPGTVNAAVDTLRSYVHLRATTTLPSWRDDKQRPPAGEILPCKSMSLHIPTGEVLRPTPLLFNTNALEFDFDPKAPAPTRWLAFLSELFGVDTESLNLLQEWFGYCLVADTSQQKMLLLVGPRRSGKGTIARVLGKLIGSGNVCGPTVGSLASNFGLQPLLGKSLAVVSDARFAGENIGVVVERLLCISGEDAISIDRKFLTSVTMKLPTRFMFLTNELPRFNDASTALAGRFLVLRLTKSFYGNEDIGLTNDLLGELPGILLWSIEGWRRLHHCVLRATAEGACWPGSSRRMRYGRS